MKKVASLALALLLVLCTLLCSAAATIEEQYPIDTPYVFPLKPGMPEWADLPSYRAMIDVCQIPEEILGKMTTEALVETVMNYPCAPAAYAFDTFEMGYQRAKKNFNGLRELEQRADARQVLSERASPLRALSDGEKVTSDFWIEDISKLLSETTGTNAVPRATLSYVYTPRGTRIPVLLNRSYADANTTPERLAQNDRDTAALFPSVQKVGPVTPAYNCHSYALVNPSTSNNIYMGDTNTYPLPASFYFKDGSYTKVGRPAPGNILTYSTDASSDLGPVHTAIINTIYQDDPNMVTAKWGNMGLYRGHYMHSPYAEDAGYHFDAWARS